MLIRSKKRVAFLAGLAFLLGVSLLFVGCGKGKKAPSEVDAASIQYDGYVVTWSPAEGAENYELNINGNSYTVYGSTQFSYLCESFPADGYTITIHGKNSAGVGPDVSKSFTKLPTMDESTLSFNEDGVMSWTPVAGALSYQVEVNGTAKSVAGSTEFSDFEYGVRNSIRVRPIGADGTFSLWSAPVSRTYLAVPTQVDYDGQTISWRGVSNASSYTVFINGVEHENVTASSLLYDSNQTDFGVEVRAEGNGKDSFRSKKSESVEFVFLGQVQNVRVEDGDLVWDSIEKAVSYSVEVSGAPTQSVTDCRFRLTEGTKQTIRIKPLGAKDSHTFSEWSAPQSYLVLSAPELHWNENIKLDGDPNRNLFWDANNVGNVSGYRIRLQKPDGGVETSETQSSLPSFLYGYTDVGTYRVSVQTIAAIGSDAYDSRYSREVVVIRLPAPKLAAQGSVTSDPCDLEKGFTIHYNIVSGASRYRLYRDGRETDQYSQGMADSMDVREIVGSTMTEMQTIPFGLQSIGSVKTEGGITTATLDSLTRENAELTIRVLPMPTNVEINGATLTWGSIASAAGYSVRIEGNTDTSNPSFDLTAIRSVGSHSVQVCAKGDGAMILPSRYTASIKVTKLGAPTGIRVETGNDEGRLHWDPIANAKSFNVYLNGSQTPEADISTVNINKEITTDTITLVMEAVANYWDDAHTEYFLTSDRSNTVTFTKLKTPTFGEPAFSNSELLWNAPANMQNANITYRVYNGAGEEYHYAIDGTRMNISNLEGGQHYSFQVRAIGDGRQFINSELSTQITVEKLNTPTVKRENGCYIWNRVSGATGYQVRVGGKLAATVSRDGELKYIPAFDEVTTYSVEVIAVGDGGVESIDSTPFHIDQKVEQIKEPGLARPTYDPKTRMMKIELTRESDYATGYRYMVNEIVVAQKETALSFEYHIENKGLYTASVVALGQVFDDKGVFYIDSDPVGGNTNYGFELLSAPTQSTLSVDTDGRLHWGSTGSREYEIEITLDDGSTKSATVSNGNPFYDASAEGINKDKIRSFKVRSKGNGTTTYDSDWVEWTRK